MGRHSSAERWHPFVAAAERMARFLHHAPVLYRCVGGLALAAGLQAASAQAAAPALQGAAVPAAQGSRPGGGIGLPSQASGRSPFAPKCSRLPYSDTEEEFFFSWTHAETSPHVAANPSNPLGLVGIWHQDPGTVLGGDGIGLAASSDGGLTWRRSYPPVTRCSGGTAADIADFERTRRVDVAFSPNGVAHYITHSFNVYEPGDTQGAVLVGRSTDGGRNWSAPVPLMREQGYGANDATRIAADPRDSRYVYAVWVALEYVEGKAWSPALLARSIDNGVTWESGPFIEMGDEAQTISHQLKVLPDGTLVYVSVAMDAGYHLAGYSSRSTDRGLTWSRPVKVADMLPVFADFFQPEAFVQDAGVFMSVALDPRNGTLYAVWEDGRFSGMEHAGVALSQSRDGGRTWSEPVQVNRESKAQAFVPTVHVRFDGQVAVSYYDLRSDTADPATLPADLWLTRSRDGLNWRERRISGPFDMAKAPKLVGLRTVGIQSGLTSIGPLYVPFYSRPTSSSDLTDRTDILSQWVLGAAADLAQAAQDPAALARQLDREDESLPAYNVQGTQRPVSGVPALWRQRAAKAAQALLDRQHSAVRPPRVAMPQPARQR